MHIFRLAKVHAFLLSISLEVEPLGRGVCIYLLEEIQEFFASSRLILMQWGLRSHTQPYTISLI